MEFFKEVNNVLKDGMSLNMTIAKRGAELIVSVLPKSDNVKDKAVQNIPPMIVKGVYDELDQEFAKCLLPIEATVGMLCDVESYERSVEAAKEATEMAKKAKDAKKAAMDEYGKWVKLAKQNLEQNKFADAIKCVTSAITVAEKAKIPTDAAKAFKMKAEQSLSSPGLFGAAEDKSDGKAISLSALNTKVEKPKETETETEEEEE